MFLYYKWACREISPFSVHIFFTYENINYKAPIDNSNGAVFSFEAIISIVLLYFIKSKFIFY